MFWAKSNGSIFKHLQYHLYGAGRQVHQGHGGAHNVVGGLVNTLCYTCFKPSFLSYPIEMFSNS